MTDGLKVKLFKALAVALPVAAAVFWLGIWFGQSQNATNDHSDDVEQLRLNTFGKNQYKFINPLINCSIALKKENAEFKILEERVKQVTDKYLAQGKATHVSVYFDTNDGRWLSIKPLEIYSPASLAKLPAAIAIFKQAETQPELLNKTLVYDGSYDYNAGQYFKPAKTLTIGQPFSVNDLVRHMLTYSDNNVFQLLEKEMDKNTTREIYGDLGITLPSDANPAADFMTVKQYANFFNELYNASYLNSEHSEKLLDWLSKIDFKQGLVADLSPDITVAHKFGQRDFPLDFPVKDLRGLKELHDCGIVYYPTHPYLLCVMTKGKNFDDLAEVISGISKTVYDFKEERYREQNKQ